MSRKSMFALIVVLAALTGAAGAAPVPGPSQIQYWQSFGMTEPGGYLGVDLDDVDAESAESLDLPEERGARIDRVEEGSPADEAGFKSDDVVLSWNGTRVESARQLKRMVTETPAGRKVRLGVHRDGGLVELEPVIGSRAGRSTSGGGGYSFDFRPFHGMPGGSGGRIWPQIDPDEDAGTSAESGQPPKLGVAMLPLSEQLAAYFGLEDRGGVLIASVLEESAAEAAGLRAGDILLDIDDEAVGAPADVQRIIARKTGLVDLQVLRDKNELSIGAELRATEDEEDGEGEEERSFPRNAM